MTNAAVLEQIGEAMYGGRWKADLAGDLGLSARMLRLYAAGTQPVPDAVVDRARGLARARAETLLALAGDAVPIVTSTAKARPVAVPLDGEEYLALAKRIGNQCPAGMSGKAWASQNATERRIRSRETGVEMTLRGIGTFKLQLWGEVGRLEVFNLRTESDRLALADYTIADPV